MRRFFLDIPLRNIWQKAAIFAAQTINFAITYTQATLSYARSTFRLPAITHTVALPICHA